MSNKQEADPRLEPKSSERAQSNMRVSNKLKARFRSPYSKDHSILRVYLGGALFMEPTTCHQASDRWGAGVA